MSIVQKIFSRIFQKSSNYLADYIQGILSRKAQAEKSGYSQSLYNLKNAAKMLIFLQVGNIMDMTGLDEKFKSMIGEQLDIQGKLKLVERHLATLKKHLEQADIYFKYKGKKRRKSERVFTVSCGRSSGNSTPAKNRIWSDKRKGGGIVNASAPPPCFGLLLDR